ncbi:MAG: hypothetical protein HYY26_02350 [Acidobacteria bacterium]|nr:hypothetical protein [Acidobacteriota bacterium]
MIEKYDFGFLRHDGKEYRRDVIIYPEQGNVDGAWWRKEGHRLDKDDLRGVVAAKPDVLVVGTGYHGCMQVPQETLDFLNSLGIEVYAERTAEACQRYNELKDVRKVVAALHLTC